MPELSPVIGGHLNPGEREFLTKPILAAAVNPEMVVEKLVMKHPARRTRCGGPVHASFRVFHRGAARMVKGIAAGAE
jgi:hypothetical protein